MYLNVLETMGMGVGSAASEGKVEPPCFDCCLVGALIGEPEPPKRYPCQGEEALWGPICEGDFCYGEATFWC